METYTVKCTNCSEVAYVTSNLEPNFCTLCGNKEIVVKSINDDSEQAGVTAKSDYPQEPVDKCEAPRETADFDGVLQPEPEPTFLNIGDCEDFGTLDDFTFEVRNAPAQGTDEWLAWRKDGFISHRSFLQDSD